MSLSVLALVFRSVTVLFNVTPRIAGASTATMVDTWEGLLECTSPALPGSSAPTSPHEQTLMRAPSERT